MDLLTQLQNALPAVLIYQSFLMIDPITPFPKLQNERLPSPISQIAATSSQCDWKLLAPILIEILNLWLHGKHTQPAYDVLQVPCAWSLSFHFSMTIFFPNWDGDNAIQYGGWPPQSQSFISSFHFFSPFTNAPQFSFYQVIIRWWLNHPSEKY